MLPTDASRFQAQLTPTLAPDSPTRLLRPIRPLTDPSPCPRSQKGAPALPNLKTCPIPSLAQSLTQHDPCYRRNQQAILWNNGTRRPIDGMFVDDSVCEVVPKGSTWGALAHVSRPTLIARTNPSSSSGAHPWGGARTQVIPARCAADQPPRPPFDTGCTQHRPSSPSPTQPHPASPSPAQPHPAVPSLLRCRICTRDVFPALTARNPVPRIHTDNFGMAFVGNCTDGPPRYNRWSGAKTDCQQFPSPCPEVDTDWHDASGFDSNDHEGACSGDWTLGMVADHVIIPEDTKPGRYVIGWRMDCEETAQVWASCADVHITAAP